MEDPIIKLNGLSNIIANKIIDRDKTILKKIKVVSIIIGNDQSSLSYLRGLQKKANKLGLQFEIVELPFNISENDFFEKLDYYNNNPEYTGILIQVPLPKQIDYFKVSTSINYKKDLDGIHPYNIGRLVSKKPFMIPATALAVDLTVAYIEKEFNYKIEGKNAVIIGRSLTVGKPVFHLLLDRNITPTIVHTRTQDIKDITAKADILIVSAGVPRLIESDWIKEGAVVIDVGIHCLDANNEKGYILCGDVNQDAVATKSLVVTAVPGGIGTVTNTLIFANALKCYYKINEDKEIELNF